MRAVASLKKYKFKGTKGVFVHFMLMTTENVDLYGDTDVWLNGQGSRRENISPEMTTVLLKKLFKKVTDQPRKKPR